ncbi:MAG: ABC-F family ATP-binding cassette domain-containing protein, partial [Pseudobutyrivibrio sp.]|nr:ABC-F family ATP-binding cassette domain-containing protein [Pseudobutyrivibrio sp.]
GRLLASSPDLLLLDEPINHFDLKSIMWLEGYLSSYKGAVIIVAHDRYFLDKIADHVVDLSYGRTSVYTGNYTAFTQQKEIYMLTYERSYEKQQKEIEHQKAVIDKLQSFNREKSIKRAESRKKLLDKMDVMDAPDKDMPKMRLTLEIEKESGKDVLDFSHVTKSYDDKNIFTDLSFEVHKGDRIAILGDNGTGKTTILKCINGLTDFESGEIRFGANVTVGYYDQEQQGLTESNTIFSELHDAYPFLTETKVRNTLAAFMFTEDDVFKRISDLSGGERGRVSLAKLMLSKSNLLILDEPTNHLDMDSKQMLEEALNEYDGTLLYVSHDRYFVNRTANTILELTDGKLVKYLGNYDDYIAKKEQLYGTTSDSVSTAASEETAAKLDYKEQKRIEAEKRKLQNKISKIEEEIEELESKKSAIEEEFLKPENMTNSAKLNELTAKQKEIDSRLEELYDEWGLLNP